MSCCTRAYGCNHQFLFLGLNDNGLEGGLVIALYLVVLKVNETVDRHGTLVFFCGNPGQLVLLCFSKFDGLTGYRGQFNSTFLHQLHRVVALRGCSGILHGYGVNELHAHRGSSTTGQRNGNQVVVNHRLDNNIIYVPVVDLVYISLVLEADFHGRCTCGNIEVDFN